MKKYYYFKKAKLFNKLFIAITREKLKINFNGPCEI